MAPKGTADDPQAHQPEQTNRERILQLGDKPVPQRPAGDLDMFLQFHTSSDAPVGINGSHLTLRPLSGIRAPC